jgi:hypothetical protein
MRFTIPELRTALAAVLHVLCPAMRIGFESAAAIPLCADYETIEKWIGVAALLVFALFELVPSWRSAVSNILSSIGSVLV